jgi:hypothetical protein
MTQSRKPYEWVYDPKSGMFWQRPTGVSSLTADQRSKLFDAQENARAALRYMRSRYAAPRWPSIRRCERCGRYMRQRAVRYFGGLRRTWVCPSCDKGRHG